MANDQQRGAGYPALIEKYAGYTVRDSSGDKIGKVDDLFLDENDQPEYFGVKMGFLGTKSTLIPADIATVDEARGFVDVSQGKSTVKNGPAFNDDNEITPEYENEVRSYYGLGPLEASGAGGAYADYSSSDAPVNTSSANTSVLGDGSVRNTPGANEAAGEVGPGVRMGDIDESGQFRGHAEGNEGVNQTDGSDLDDTDEMRVQRSEEELVAGTREREAGSMRVKKRVRTDRERIAVPTRHEEVRVDRVPVEGRVASESEIGEDEVTMLVTEEEVVVSKRAVVKEEVRVSTDVVRDEEVVEADVRKEAVEVVDETTPGGGTTTGRGL